MSNISTQKQVMIPTSLINEIELTDAQLEAVSGGYGGCEEHERSKEDDRCEEHDWYDNNNWWGGYHCPQKHFSHKKCHPKNPCDW